MGCSFRHLFLLMFYVYKIDCIMFDDSLRVTGVDIASILRSIINHGYNALERPRGEIRNSRLFRGATHFNLDERFQKEFTPALQKKYGYWKASIVWEIIFPNAIEEIKSQMDDRKLLCIKVVNEQIFRGKILRESVIDVLLKICEKSEMSAYSKFRKYNEFSSLYKPAYLFSKKYREIDLQSNEYATPIAVDHALLCHSPSQSCNLQIRLRNVKNYKTARGLWTDESTNHNASEKYHTRKGFSRFWYLQDISRTKWIEDSLFSLHTMTDENNFRYHWQPSTIHVSSRKNDSEEINFYFHGLNYFKSNYMKRNRYIYLMQTCVNNDKNLTNFKHRRISWKTLTNVSLLYETRGSSMSESAEIEIAPDLYFVGYHDEIVPDKTEDNTFWGTDVIITVFIISTVTTVLFQYSLILRKPPHDVHQDDEKHNKFTKHSRNTEHKNSLWGERFLKFKKMIDRTDRKCVRRYSKSKSRKKRYHHSILENERLLRKKAKDRDFRCSKFKRSSKEAPNSIKEELLPSQQYKDGSSNNRDNKISNLANETTNLLDRQMDTNTTSMYTKSVGDKKSMALVCQENRNKNSSDPSTSLICGNKLKSVNSCKKMELKIFDTQFDCKNEYISIEVPLSQETKNLYENPIEENSLQSEDQSNHFAYASNMTSIQSNTPRRCPNTWLRYSLPKTSADRRLFEFSSPEMEHTFSEPQISVPSSQDNLSVTMESDPSFINTQSHSERKTKVKKQIKTINLTKDKIPVLPETEQTSLKAVEGQTLQCSETEETRTNKDLSATDLGIFSRAEKMQNSNEYEDNMHNFKNGEDSPLLSNLVEDNYLSHDRLQCSISSNNCLVCCESLTTSQAFFESTSDMKNSIDSKLELEHPSSESLYQTNLMNVDVYNCLTLSSDRMSTKSKIAVPSKRCVFKQFLHEKKERRIDEEQMKNKSVKNLYTVMYDIVQGFFNSLQRRKRKIRRKKIRRVIRELLRPRRLKRLGHSKHVHCIPVTNQEEEESLGTLSSLFNDISFQSVPIVETYRYEWSRLASFRDFVSRDVHATVLARHGWYSAGNGSTTTCFSCHRVRQNWSRNDDPRDFHDPDCRFITNSSNNIPILRVQDSNQQSPPYDNSSATTERDFVITEQSHNHEHLSNEFSSLSSNASSVYFVQNEGDVDSRQRQETSYLTERTRSDNSTVRRYQQESEIRQRVSTMTQVTSAITPTITQARNADIRQTTATTTPQATAANTPTRETQLAALMRDPMGINFDRPKYPSYAILAVRLGSYSDWPTAMTQTPRDMALAGFFYAGYGDYTRCFFCGGGLRNWEAGDDPWVEHARWFSKCAFVRQNRGQQFIDLVLRRAAEMEEHSEPQGGKGAGSVQEKEADSNDERRSKEEKIMNSAAVKSIKDMGYREETIKAAINTIKSRLPRGKHKVSAHEILEVIFELADKQRTESPVRSQSVETTTMPRGPSANISEQSSDVAIPNRGEVVDETSADRINSLTLNDLESLKRENSSLKDQIQCKICMERNVSVAFLPCGHLACCSDCAPAMRKCPICREFVRGTVKTYLV